MKRFIFILFSLTSLAGLGQIKEVSNSVKFEEITKVGGDGISPFVSSMSIFNNNDGTNDYLWIYNNLKYHPLIDIKSIVFTASEDEYQKLYTTLKDFMNAEDGAEKHMDLSNERVVFKISRSLGTPTLNVHILKEGGSFFMLSKRQLYKLFKK